MGEAFRGTARGSTSGAAREAQRKRHYSIKRPTSKRPSERGAAAIGAAARKCSSKRRMHSSERGRAAREAQQ